MQLYTRLLQINYSPSVALHRTFALYKANGWEEAIVEAEKLKLNNNHFYFLLLTELYKDFNNTKARQHFETAMALAKTHTEKQKIQEIINSLS